jgi:hypothetical protein
MKMRRTLNLLAAAAGLVFLTGCATETLTDSAFWSYLPFTSHKGGKGSGGAGGGEAEPAKTEATVKGKTTDGTNPTAPMQRSTDPVSESWNDPAKPPQAAQPEKPPATAPGAASTAAGKTLTLKAEADGSPAKPAPSGMAVRTDGPNKPTAERGPTPALPPMDGKAATTKGADTLSLPNPEASQTAPKATRAPGLGDPSAPASAQRSPSSPAAAVDLPGPKAKAPRPALHLPELIVDGIGPATVGKPTLAELPKRPTTPKPTDGLNVPPVVLREANDGQAGDGAQRLPKALTEAPERRQANATPLPLPRVALDSPKAAARNATGNAQLSDQRTAAQPPSGVPAVVAPEAPTTASTAGGTLTGGVTVPPLPPKATGPAKPLPPVEASVPLPVPAIPAPFRLSEWISNDALHQAWRRQQIERTQLEPQLRGSEQQRLRLLLDTYLLREKAEEKDTK